MAIPEGGFKIVSGTPKAFSKTSDSGKEISNHFCGDCGSTLYRTGGAFPGLVIIKVGIMDDVDAFEKAKPGAELFSTQRVEWVPEIQGAQQMKTMS